MSTAVIDITQLSPEQKAELMAQLNQEQELAEMEARTKRELYEQQRETTIQSLMGQALEINDIMQGFKNEAFAELRFLSEFISETTTKEDWKGNFTIKSRDGKFKIEYSRQVLGDFDERSNEAVNLISEFVSERYQQDAPTRKLVVSLLERKNGQLDIKMVQKLYAMENEFSDEKWLKGLQLLKDSWQSGDSKEYVRFWQKDSANGWKAIKLDFASLGVEVQQLATVTEEGGEGDS